MFQFFFKKIYTSMTHHVHIYTDGSHIKGTRLLGFGAWCKFNDQEYWLSGVGTPEWMEKTYGIRSNRISNPTMELVACCQILELFQYHKVHILLYVDYEGVAKWIQGKWRAKKPYIKILVDLCKQYIQNIDGVVSFIDVSSHSGVKGNELADKAAKDTECYNTFPELLKHIPSITEIEKN